MSLEVRAEFFGLWLPVPRLISPSLDTSPLLFSKLGSNSRLGAVLGPCL